MSPGLCFTSEPLFKPEFTKHRNPWNKAQQLGRGSASVLSRAKALSGVLALAS